MYDILKDVRFTSRGEGLEIRNVGVRAPASGGQGPGDQGCTAWGSGPAKRV